MELLAFRNTLESINSNLNVQNEALQRNETVISNNEKALKEAENQLFIARGKIFDDSSLICPTCGQAYPAEKALEMKERFENNLKDEIGRLTDYIESMKNAIAEARNNAQATKSKIDYDAGAKKSIEAKIKAMEEKLSKMIFEKVEDNEQYKAKKAEIDALMQKVGVSTFDLEKAEIGAKIEAIDRKLAQVESNNRIEERIGQLKEEQKVVGHNVLKQERMIALLEDYSKAKIALLEDSVNQYFSLIKWRFFSELINGGYTEVCKLLVSGIDYEVSLNKSDKILCQVDLVNGFMKANGVSLPVMFDDAESIDSDRLPEIDGQMIVFRRDDCKLTVKEM